MSDEKDRYSMYVDCKNVALNSVLRLWTNLTKHNMEPLNFLTQINYIIISYFYICSSIPLRVMS